MQGSQAIIKVTPEVCPPPVSGWRDLEIEDRAAEISKGIDKKNGDRQFEMTITGDMPWKNRKVIILLYKNTHQCFVQIYNKRNGNNTVNFRGEIYPMKLE